MQELPLELVREILQYLNGDRPTLRSCSVVRSSWIQISQEILFNTFTIDEKDDPASSCSAFLKLLKTSPHLASYIRYLMIVFKHWSWHTGKSQIHEVACLPDLLSYFTKLETLNIQANHEVWANLPRDLIPSLVPLLPNLKALFIVGPSLSKHGMELVRFLGYCTARLLLLKLLDLRFMTWSRIGPNYPAQKVVLPGVVELWSHFDEISEGSFVKDSIQTPNLRRYHGQGFAADLSAVASSRSCLPSDRQSIQELALSVAFAGGQHSLFTNEFYSLSQHYAYGFHHPGPETLSKLEKLKTLVYLSWSGEPAGEQVWEKIGSALRAFVRAGTFKSAFFYFSGQVSPGSEAPSPSQELIESAKKVCGDLIESGVMEIVLDVYIDDDEGGGWEEGEEEEEEE
ncbi:hypothetical protein ONZ45_g13783 [Pleurotus djamor]|nr:hypothetical protein ONZ45_g13783 [Pleurotus djamor]